MKNYFGLILGVFALFAIALAIPAVASDSGTPQAEKHEEAKPGYTCKGDGAKLPGAFKGAFKKACEAAKTEGKKPITKMMNRMKKSLKKKCNEKAAEGKTYKAFKGCKPCHSGAGKAGNIDAAAVKKSAGCDASYYADK